MSKWIVLGCMAITVGWAFQDFYKKSWTPNERLVSSLLVLYIVINEMFSYVAPLTLFSVLVSLSGIIAFLAVILLETAFDVRAYKRKRKEMKKHD